ncbi:MAG: glycoside hydrolase family 1 protein [Candidatus Omnitrophota bacterium]
MKIWSMEQIKFPKDFLWGAATSAYQVEGGNSNSDWWPWEKRTGVTQSGAACRHYELFKEDFDIASSLGHNAHRLSIEWARIEPEEGKFSEQEIRHYQDVILALKSRGIEPVVTLHHFTNPVWFANSGGWENSKASVYFGRFCKKIVNALKNDVRFWVTINEPMVYLYHSYVLGVWPPQKKSFFTARKVLSNIIKGHVAAYRLIHKIYKEENLPNPLVSIAHNMQDFVPCRNNLKDKAGAYLRDKLFNRDIIRILLFRRSLDYIGLNYYTRGLVEVKKWGFMNLLSDNCESGHSNLKKNDMGWDIYPKGIYDLLSELKSFKLPIFILENGICTADDNARWDYIREHLENVHKAMAEGAKVLGYIYWSLLDNFEWDKGFWPRFGLVEMDYNNFQRRVRESGKKFAEVCRTGRL